MPEQNSTPQDPIGSDLVKEDPSYADIVVKFVEGLSTRLSTMEDAITSADFEALRVAAHQLKGSGGGYGYPLLTQYAAQIEQQARQESLDQCAKELEALKQLCTRIVATAD